MNEQERDHEIEIILTLIFAMATGLLIGALLLCPACHAQDLPDKPIIVEHPTFGNIDIELTYNGRQKWHELIPVPHETKDRAFWSHVSASVLCTFMDVENSVYTMNHSHSRELNPIYGSHPGRGRYYIIALPVAAATSYLSYRYKRESDALRARGYEDHKWRKWWIPDALNGGSHIVGILFTFASTGK